MLRYLGSLLALALLAGCPPSVDTGADGGGPIRVGPEGGVYYRNGAVLEIPGGALDSETLITVTPIEAGLPDIPGRKRVSPGYRITPSEVVFKVPVRLSLAYEEERVPEGVEPGAFDMRRQEGNDAYLALPNPSAVVEYKVEQADTDRLGIFWVTSPSEASLETLTLEPSDVALQSGQTQQLTAVAEDPAGNPIDLPITFAARPPRAGSIDAQGLFTALGPGNVTVTARAGKLSAVATIRIAGTASGPRSFLHDNPFPTGNDLKGGAFGEGGAFFVGANATVLQRASADQWTRRFSSTGLTLHAIAGSSARAVAVGLSGNNGALVEVGTGIASPAVQLFTTVQPRAVWFDGTQGMAVGDGNDVIVRSGSSWVKAYSPSFESLLSVVGDGAGGFVTLGARGSIYRFDPTTQTWNSLYQTQLAVRLNSATLVNAAGTEAWAVGGPSLWHFTGSSWTAIDLPATPVLTELTAVGLVDGKVAVGARAERQGFLLVHDPAGAGSWTSQPLRGPQIVRSIFSSGAEAFAVGDLGTVWRYGAGTFVEESRGFYGNVVDVSVGPAGVVAAANECASTECSARVGSVMLRTGASQWARLGAAFSAPVYSMAARTASDVVVGGNARIDRFDGAAWSQVAVAGTLQGPIRDLQFCGDELWAVGERGVILHGTSTQLTSINSPAFDDLYAIHCPSPGEVWVAGTYGLYEMTPGPVFVGRSSAVLPHSLWRGVWSPGAGEAFTVGVSQYAAYWDTAELHALSNPGGPVPDALTGIWGSTIDNLYLIGQTVTPESFGYAARFNGAEWQLIDSGAQRKLYSIQGAGTEVWIGTEGGGVLRGINP